LSKERVRERLLADFTTQNPCGSAKFGITSPAARSARGDLSWDKERLKILPCGLRKGLK